MIHGTKRDGGEKRNGTERRIGKRLDSEIKREGKGGRLRSN
jgi:hypothetical protein